MNKWLMIIPIMGLVFLSIFLIFNPVTGGIALVITLPFIIYAIIVVVQRNTAKKELQETIRVFLAEKEEIIKEIKRKEDRQREQYELLQGFGKDLSTALNKDQLLRLIVSMFAKVTQTASGDSQCFLISHVPGSEEFEYEIGYNFDSTALKSLRFNDGDEVIQMVVKSRKITTYISDIFGGDTNIRYFLKDDKVSFLSEFGSLALIPLCLEEDVWGIIIIFCNEGAAARIKNEELFFMLMVAQASIALGSAIHRGLASIDRLTQLYNRNFLQKRMNEEIEFCNRQQLPLSIIMLDIDHFKDVNDTYGHHEGDMVLKKIAQILSKSVRLTDVCARYGGEEFVVVLSGICESPNDKFSIAERLRATVESTEFIVMGVKQIKVTISVGVTVRRFPDDKDVSIDDLIRRADTLLYKAKKEGRNRVCYSGQ